MNLMRNSNEKDTPPTQNEGVGKAGGNPYQLYKKNLELALKRISSELRDELDREYFRTMHPKFYKKYLENEEKKR